MESGGGEQQGSAPSGGEQKKDDTTFLNLLSSQRRLLSEISSGAQSTATVASSQRSGLRPPYASRLSGELVHNRMNQPISQQSLSTEPYYSKTSATGSDRFMDGGSDHGFMFSSFEAKAAELDNDTKLPAKRKPSLGLGTSLSFLESERGSESQEVVAEETGDAGKDNENEEDEDDGDLSSIEPLDYKYDYQTPMLLINELLALDQAMARSQESQLLIQNWDKQMGLKRSHSKTMRLSNRSRKMVRAFLKKEISAVSQPQVQIQEPSEGEQV